MFFNIRRLLNILYDPTPSSVSEVLLSLNAEKAFDRVEWDFLFYVLEKFGFGSKCRHWVKVLYTSPVAAVCTNNNLSPLFSLQRGTRQGCTLSPLLFALVIEPLAVALRERSTIKGIHRGDIEHKVSLYADDMLVYLSHPLTSLPALIELLNDFGKISGYKINMQKSELMPLNFTSHSILSNYFPFKISTEKFKYLGIWVTHKYHKLYKANFCPLINNLKQDLECWNLLLLSLGGRINTVKMNVLPRFLFLFQSLPIFLTKSFFMNIDTLISDFIWNRKTPRMRKNILQRHRSCGGLSLPNFQQYYWASNIKFMLYWVNPSDSPAWLLLEKASCKSALSALLCTKIPLSDPV